MNSEDRLRRALRDHAERIEPAGGNWEQIQRRAEDGRRRRRRAWAGGTTGAVAAAVLAVVGLLALVDGGNQVVRTGPAAVTSTTEALDSYPFDFANPSGYVPGVWPFLNQEQLDSYRATGETAYDDPREVARAFAVEFLGIADPVVGTPDGPEPGGDLTVAVQPRGESGEPLAPGVLETVVYLDPKGPPFQVLRAASTNLQLDGNEYFRNALTSPLPVSGVATAFEGTVQVEIRQVGMDSGNALGRRVVTAGAQGTLRPFTTDVTFDVPPTGGHGALVLLTESPVDGSTMEATVTGLTFGGDAGTLVPTPNNDQTEITVFFLQGEELVPVARSVPATTGVLRASLEALLAGPTTEEREAGLGSLVGGDESSLLDVTIDSNGKAVIDLASSAISGAVGTTAGSSGFAGQLYATVFQFPTVTSAEFRIDGSCEAFHRAMESPVCRVIERPGGG